MNNNISLMDIKAFVVIAELGSFTNASESLNVSRSHLSRQLSGLEKQLGAELIIRTTRSQRLTDTGKKFYEKCRKSLQTIDQAVIDVIDDAEQLRGDIAINCVGGIIGEETIGNIIADFGQLYPDININLDFSSYRVDLIEDQFDLVVRMGELSDSTFVARMLTEISIGALASPDYISRYGMVSHPDQLARHNCLTGSVKNWSFHQAGKPKQKANITVSGNLECKNGRALINAALNGNGIVRLPNLYCQQEIEQGRLVSVLKGWTINTVPIYLLYHKKNLQSQRLKRLIEFIIKQFPKD